MMGKQERDPEEPMMTRRQAKVQTVILVLLLVIVILTFIAQIIQ